MRGQRFGPYELLRKIAAGGMAEIFLARHWAEGGFFRDVVIKRLFGHMAEHRRALKMFQYEARLLAELSHPNIPQVFELGVADGHWYIAMEYVDGHNVADVWRTGARGGHVMSMQIAAGVLLQACEALHHAHERRDRAGRALRIVHRDVTPHNIMVTRDGVVKVMDFGVAQTAARTDTEHGTVKGTFSYMAPEQVRARPLDKRADVFALGVILYELTTGTRLYPGTDVQVMTAIVEKDPPPPSTRVPNYPADLEEIVMSALSRDRGARLPSAAHFALALEEFALRHGIVIGPRVVSRYVSTVFPYQREKEHEVALVAPQLEVVPEEDDGGWDEETEMEMEGALSIDEAGVLEDLELLEPDEEIEAATREEVSTSSERPVEGEAVATPAFGRTVDPSVDREIESLLKEEGADESSVPPPPLAGFDEDRGDSIVVLDPEDETEDDHYMTELEKRLKKGS